MECTVPWLWYRASRWREGAWRTAGDDTAHIIVAAELINNASDARELPTMVEAVKEALGIYPDQTLADAGYRSAAVFEALAGRTKLVVAIGREGKSTAPSTKPRCR